MIARDAYGQGAEIKHLKLPNMAARKRTIFDGAESELAGLMYSLKCPSCGGQLNLLYASSRSFAELEPSRQEQIAGSIKGVIKTRVADAIFYRFNGFSLAQQWVSCEPGADLFLAITANGEYQPGRYMVYLLGLFVVEEA